MRVMIDTNIIISAVLFPNGQAAAALMKAMTPPCEPIVCDYIIDEVQRKFREKFPGRMVELEAFLWMAGICGEPVFSCRLCQRKRKTARCGRRVAMDVMDVADFFIDLANSGDPEEDDGMTNMKLNKLLYFAQAASLQRFGRPLFDESLEAWKYGPVVPRVYREFKKYGRDSILKTARPFDWRGLDGDTVDLLVDVYRAYAVDYTAMGLMRMTHRPGTPWSQTYRPDETREIPVDSIRRWVGDNPLDIDMPPVDEGMVVTAKIDRNGHPVLPAEWVDDDGDDDGDE